MKLYHLASVLAAMTTTISAFADTALPASSSLLSAVWPAQIPMSPEGEAITQAMRAAVEADVAEPALSSHAEDFAAGVMTAYFESALHGRAAGDCKKLAWSETDADGRQVWHPESPLKQGFSRSADVPPGVLCRAYGAWQQTKACGRADLPEQARCWLAELHRSARECPAHPMASLASGGVGCTRGTKLSDWRMSKVRGALSKTYPPLAMQ